MVGAKESHTGYIYRRIGGEEMSSSAALCDPFYRNAYEQVQMGREHHRDYIATQLHQELQLKPARKKKSSTLG